ncbi:hypothetical protein E4T38_03052 [Aureobasidium subglaciale]|nr:hypothetical protein E4T38_03052 [Aureobasidium subglaciale]KAI5226855.1 hypothetical protein E4T40_02826 [Aureobasidium subglaciale]KAI5230128.1 hypothetical protein E4T41_03049 [Aureobasidium subglaciale]KAI5264662.1 hypothetical protein E4T46_02827 [Aureobasidium subglaciale]
MSGLTRYRHLVSAGALIIALGFMVEPFLQAIISDYGRLVDQESNGATIGRSFRLDGGTQCILTYPSRHPKVDTTPGFSISASVYDGLNAATSNGFETCPSRAYPVTVLGLISDNLKRTNLEDRTKTTTSTTRKPSSKGLATSATSLDNSPVSAATEDVASYPVAPLPIFSDVSPLNSLIAPIKSSATKATVGIEKRATSSASSSSARQTKSPITWSDWTLEYLDLTLTNTNEAWRAANTFSVLQAAVVANPNCTVNFKGSQALLAAFTALLALFTVILTDNSHTLGSASWDAADASAMECGLESTLNVYNSSVVNNILIEHVVASASQKVPDSWLPVKGVDQTYSHPNGLEIDSGTFESNPVYHHKFLHRDDYAIDPAPLQKGISGNFSIAQSAMLCTVDFLASLIKQENDNGTVKAVTQDNLPPLYTYGSPVLQPLYNQTDLNATLDAIARSMSNAIRSLGSKPMLGKTQQWVKYYQIDDWKANSVATMLYGPEETT